MSTAMCSAGSSLSFRRIIDVPFEICVSALESWQRTGQGGELSIGYGVLRWPIEDDRDCGTCRIEVGLARGLLRPQRRMRLDINRWSPPSSRTALELIPCQRVRPSAAYFRSGHLLLDSLTHSLLEHMPVQHLDRVPTAPNCQMPAHLGGAPHGLGSAVDGEGLAHDVGAEPANRQAAADGGGGHGGQEADSTWAGS